MSLREYESPDAGSYQRTRDAAEHRHHLSPHVRHRVGAGIDLGRAGRPHQRFSAAPPFGRPDAYEADDPLVALAAARALFLAKQRALGQPTLRAARTDLDERWALPHALLFSVTVGLALWAMIVAVGIWLFG